MALSRLEVPHPANSGLSMNIQVEENECWSALKIVILLTNLSALGPVHT